MATIANKEEEVDILDVRPHWIIRNGNWLFLSLLLLIGLIAWLIQIPFSSSSLNITSAGKNNIKVAIQGKELKKLGLSEKNKIVVQLKSGSEMIPARISTIAKTTDSLYTVEITSDHFFKTGTSLSLGALTITKKTKLFTLIYNKLHL